MCFSATASFVAGTALTIGGVATLKKTTIKSEIPFASIPLFFGIQQLIEAVIWLSFDVRWLNVLMTSVYSMFSHIGWPIFVPLAVLLLERNHVRKKILYFFVLIGLAGGLYLLYFVVQDPVTSRIVNYSIAYTSPHLDAVLALSLYLLATCVSCLVSSYRLVNYFGALLFLSFYVSHQFYNSTFFSVWCFFAAILSVIVYLHFHSRPNLSRRTKRRTKQKSPR